MDTEKYDVVVVGLGCVGLSTSLYCAKQGLKVLGIEKAPKEGFIGTSSFGETRMWRESHMDKFKNDMMKDALPMWEELEKESGKELLSMHLILLAFFNLVKE